MDYTLGDVLREVNNIRFYEFSLPPLEKLPKGSCKSPIWCVIARCFPVDKNYEAYSDGSQLVCMGTITSLPQVIREFITDFDNGKWPSLVDKDSKERLEEILEEDSEVIYKLSHT
jgi:hypothetical protein